MRPLDRRSADGHGRKSSSLRHDVRSVDRVLLVVPVVHEVLGDELSFGADCLGVARHTVAAGHWVASWLADLR